MVNYKAFLLFIYSDISPNLRIEKLIFRNVFEAIKNIKPNTNHVKIGKHKATQIQHQQKTKDIL